jgi:hypothetical protein
MAHFAKIEAEGNKVLTVLAVDNKDLLNADGVEDETVGQQYLEQHNNWPAHLWIQTSYSTTGGKHNSGDDSKAFRGNYAGIGYTWDEDNNIFYPQKPFASWILNTTTATWHSPIGDAPDDLTDEEKVALTSYVWNEGTGAWDKETPEA